METKTGVEARKVEARIRGLSGLVSTPIVDRAVIAALAEKDAVDTVRDQNRSEALAAAATIHLVMEMRGPATADTAGLPRAMGRAAQVLAEAAGIKYHAYQQIDAEILTAVAPLRQAAFARLIQEHGGPGPGLWDQALAIAGEELPNHINVADLVYQVTGLNLNYFLEAD